MLQILLWFSIILLFSFISAYIYVNEKEKNDSLKLSEEIEILKEFQEKEKIRIQNKNIKTDENII